jgi:hypothetical protein
LINDVGWPGEEEEEMPPEEVVRHVVEENLWRDDEFIGQFSKEPPGNQHLNTTRKSHFPLSLA